MNTYEIYYDNLPVRYKLPSYSGNNWDEPIEYDEEEIEVDYSYIVNREDIQEALLDMVIDSLDPAKYDLYEEESKLINKLADDKVLEDYMDDWYDELQDYFEEAAIAEWEDNNYNTYYNDLKDGQ